MHKGDLTKTAPQSMSACTGGEGGGGGGGKRAYVNLRDQVRLCAQFTNGLCLESVSKKN